MRYTPKAVLCGVATAVGVFAVTAVVTGFLPNPLFERAISRSALDAVFLVSVTALVGLCTCQQVTRTDCTRKEPGLFGAIGGFLAVTCPHCFPVLAGASSPSVVGAYLVVRPGFGVAAVAVLAGTALTRERRLVTEGPAVAETELRCPTCGALLKDAVDDPDPDISDDRLQVPLACHGCADPLVVVVEATAGDEIEIRKRVVRRAAVEA